MTAVHVTANVSSLCAGAEVTANAVATGGTVSTYSWSWRREGTGDLREAWWCTGPVCAMTLDDAGEVIITALVTPLCGDPLSGEIRVNVRALPDPRITNPVLAGRSPTTYTVTAPDAGVGAQYAWTLSHASLVAGQGTSTIEFQPDFAGEDTIVGLVVQSAAGCSNWSNTAFHLLPARGFYTVPPCRLLDTRLGSDGPALASGSSRWVTAVGKCMVPEASSAVAANVTVVYPPGNGWITASPYPPGPGWVANDTSVVNYRAATTRANNVSLTLDHAGQFRLYSYNYADSPLHLVIDVVGYYK